MWLYPTLCGQTEYGYIRLFGVRENVAYPTLCGQGECGYIRLFAVRENVAIPDSLRSGRMWLYPTLCGQADVAISDTLRSDRMRPYPTLCGQAEVWPYPTLCGQTECGHIPRFAARQNVAISDALRSGFASDSIAACFNSKASSRFCVCVCVCVTGACWGREKEEAGTTTTSDLPRASECAWGAKQRSAQEPREWRRWG